MLLRATHMLHGLASAGEIRGGGGETSKGREAGCSCPTRQHTCTAITAAIRDCPATLAFSRALATPSLPDNAHRHNAQTLKRIARRIVNVVEIGVGIGTVVNNSNSSAFLKKLLVASTCAGLRCWQPRQWARRASPLALDGDDLGSLGHGCASPRNPKSAHQLMQNTRAGMLNLGAQGTHRTGSRFRSWSHARAPPSSRWSPPPHRASPQSSSESR